MPRPEDFSRIPKERKEKIEEEAVVVATPVSPERVLEEAYRCVVKAQSARERGDEEEANYWDDLADRIMENA